MSRAVEQEVVPAVRLRAFGGLSVDGALPASGGAAGQRRPLALLLLLAAAGERGVSRDKLLGLLWPDSDAEHARSALRQTLYALRRDLGLPELFIGTADLRLNAALLPSDLAEFDRAMAAGEYDRAVALYAGPMADGFFLSKAPEFERWLEHERQTRAQQFGAATQALAREASRRGDHGRAVELWRRAAAEDRLNARTAAGLMRALADSGDRASAIQYARVYESVVRGELDADPDPEVVALAEALRNTPPVPDALPAPDVVRLADQSRESTAPDARGNAAAVAEAPAALWTLGPLRNRATGLVMGALAVAAALVAAAVYAGRSWSGRAPDRTLVAVAPFRVYDTTLTLWREGLMDILARNLDGAGPLRTVAPVVAARYWHGGAHRGSAQEFARRTGAGFVIFGYVVRSGVDSVRAVASLVDADSRRTVEVDRREAVTRMDRLTDSLTVALLRELDKWRPIGATRRTTLARTTSLEALRAFLRGEQFYRRTEWDSARVWYEEAIGYDSTFALPFKRLGDVYGWQRQSADSLARAYKLRAGALNRGLGPRDSLLVLVDSLDAAGHQARSKLAAWPLSRRLFATLDEVVRRYPDDPEAWYGLGEARYHFGFGPVLSVPERATLDAFDRSIALDSAFAPAYVHTPELALNLGGPPLARRYIDAYLRLDATNRSDESTRLLRYILAAGGVRRDELTRVLDTVPGDVLRAARTALRRWPDSAETALQLSRRYFAAPRPGRYGPIEPQEQRALFLASQLAFRGHVREAQRLVGDLDEPVAFHLAYLVGSDVLASRIGRLVEKGSPYSSLAIACWGARRDTVSLERFVADARRRVTSGVDTLARLHGAYDTASALAHLALSRADTIGALGRFQTLPDTLCPRCSADRLARARLLAAQGRYREALTDLNEALLGWESPLEVLIAFERGRVAERLGEGAVAVQAYQFVADAWRFGDPEVQPYVGEARRALARLGGRRP